MKINLENLKSKKFLIFCLVFVLVVGGFFLWQWIDYQKSRPKLISHNDWVEGKYYEIIETPEGKIIENKKEGLRLVVPKEWTTEKGLSGIGIFSPDIKFKEDGIIVSDSVRKGGCMLAIEIIKSNKVGSEANTDAENLSAQIKSVQENPEEMAKQGFEDVEISGKSALKYSSKKENKTENITVQFIRIELPLGNTVYSFDPSPMYAEKCVDAFNQIIETVSINK